MMRIPFRVILMVMEYASRLPVLEIAENGGFPRVSGGGRLRFVTCKKYPPGKFCWAGQDRDSVTGW
jgi:hypothetical protein